MPDHARPPHRRLDLALAVWIGGSAGTAVRYLLSRAVPPVGPVPVGTIGINVAGALALGWLLQRLAGHPDSGRARVARLSLGTGFLGGFTTYSALALDTATLVGGGRAGLAAAYAVGTVVVGALATVGGMALGAVGRRPGERS